MVYKNKTMSTFRICPIKMLLMTAVWVVCTFTANAQIQKGIDIDGEAIYDASGSAISMPDANTVAIGAAFNDGNGVQAGHVRVFRWNGNAWVQKGMDIDGEASLDASGTAVSMPDSNTIAIGAPHNTVNGMNTGYVRVYRWNGSTWVQKGLDIDGEAMNDVSGTSVSMPDSNTVAIGAPGNSANGAYSGHVRVYCWNGGAWVQKGLDIDGDVIYDAAGTSVSMPDSNSVAIGYPFRYHNGPYVGLVRVYRWNGIIWEQKGQDIYGEASNDYSGRNVSMPDSNTVAIGAEGSDANGDESGHVRVYRWNGSVWLQKGIDIDGVRAYEYSGLSLSMPDSNTLAIGSPLHDPNGQARGLVRVFGWSGSAWEQKCIGIDGEAVFDYSGKSVSMPDANTVAMGAHFNAGNGDDAGHVRVFDICMNNTTATISPTACNSYTSPSTNYIWTTSGNYLDVIPNTTGCDSVITINLTINTVNVAVTNTSPSLTSNAAGATYQWLDCNNSFAIIAGETNQIFTATTNGSYAVSVTQNGCTDTSACVAVNNVGIMENSSDKRLNVYPNPTNGNVSIDLYAEYDQSLVIVRNVIGQEVLRKSFTATHLLQFNIPQEAGLYFVEVNVAGEKTVVKVVKE